MEPAPSRRFLNLCTHSSLVADTLLSARRTHVRRQHFFLRTPAPLSTKKWATSAAVTTQLALLALIVVYPMLHPTALSLAMTAPRITLLEPRPIPKPIPIKPQLTHQSQSATAAPTTSAPEQATLSPHFFGRIIPGIPQDDPAPQPSGPMSMTGTGYAFANLSDRIGSGTTPAVVKATPQKVRLSSGVSAGMLLAPITPVYPRIAIAAHQEGTVTLTATIDKTGHIVGLQATGGPAMLRTAAIDAVRTARYKPYLLNGEPTEVETTISVIFHLGG